MTAALRFIPVQSSADIDRVCTLAREIWPQHYASLIGMDQVTWMLDTVHSRQAIEQQINDGMHYEILSDGHDCGYMAYQTGTDACFLSKLYIRKAARGRGYGRQAMQRVISHARSHGCLRLTLTVNRGNDASIAFYEAQGWYRLHDIKIDIGGGYVMDDHLMQLDL